MREEGQIFFLGPGALFDLGVQKTGVVLAALFGMSIYFVRVWILRVELFGNVLPFVSGLSVLSW